MLENLETILGSINIVLLCLLIGKDMGNGAKKELRETNKYLKRIAEALEKGADK